MYCPNCSAQTVPGQRFCRNCGTNIGVIVDAMDGKQQRGPIDFETLKNDLKELGSNLRSGFEQFKNTHRLDKQQVAPPPNVPPAPAIADLAQELHKSIKRDIEGQINKGLRRVRVANSRKYSLQKGLLSIFSGGAIMFAWQAILEHSGNLIHSIQDIVLQQTGAPIEGLEVIRYLWMLGLIPMARGVAHLINGIFIAPKQEQVVEESNFQPPSYAYSVPYATPISAVPPASHLAGTTTNELNQKVGSATQPSVTEEATLRLDDMRAQP